MNFVFVVFFLAAASIASLKPSDTSAFPPFPPPVWACSFSFSLSLDTSWLPPSSADVRTLPLASLLGVVVPLLPPPLPFEVSCVRWWALFPVLLPPTPPLGAWVGAGVTPSVFAVSVSSSSLSESSDELDSSSSSPPITYPFSSISLSISSIVRREYWVMILSASSAVSTPPLARCLTSIPPSVVGKPEARSPSSWAGPASKLALLSGSTLE
mmetsp:Transcript_40469/g.104887  ORF Transcript_40469/g.104887 Transcript_40469/m.104887 type:complete len:212 (-) Transcript_40469:502-1137(-)